MEADTALKLCPRTEDRIPGFPPSSCPGGELQELVGKGRAGEFAALVTRPTALCFMGGKGLVLHAVLSFSSLSSLVMLSDICP